MVCSGVFDMVCSGVFRCVRPGVFRCVRHGVFRCVQVCSTWCVQVCSRRHFVGVIVFYIVIADKQAEQAKNAFIAYLLQLLFIKTCLCCC